MKNNHIFFSMAALCVAATMTCNGMMLEKDKNPLSQEKFTLTIKNDTQDIAHVTAFYARTSDLGSVKVGASRAFTIDKKNLEKVDIVAGSTRETVTEFSDKTITIKKTSASSKAAGFGGATLVGKK